MTPLEAFAYLTDSTFVSIVALTVVLAVALEALNRIGGRP